MSDNEFNKALLKVTDMGVLQSVGLDAITLSMMEMDEVRFDKVVNENIEKVGFEKTVLGLIYPFLEKMLMFWLTG